MKTLKYFSKFKKVTLLLMATLAVAACNKKGSNTPVDPYGTGLYPGPYPGSYNNCGTCSQATIPLLNSVKFQHGGDPAVGNPGNLDGNVSILGSNNGTANMSDSKAIVAYYGNVTVLGQLRVSNPNALCGAAPGIYNLQPMAPAISQLGVISGLQLTAIHTSGMGQLVMQSVGSSQVYADPAVQPNYGVYRDGPANRIGFNLSLIVNGRSCGTISTF